MARFNLKDSDEYFLALTEQPKRFDADSPVTNVFFDDSNGQVFTVRSGGVTGVTVNSMDESKCTSFRMEDRGPIISIKFSPDLSILAIQRNHENQSASVEFVNFKDLAPTNVEYSHTSRWKNAKILGFVWPRVNEIMFITDHGIELLQVLPEKKQLKSLKNVSFSAAWFAWCSQSNIVLLAGNNGLLLQPFSINNSTITKLQKLEMEAGRAAAERDVSVLRACGAAWCAVFRHQHHAEVWLFPISGPSGFHYTHVLSTVLVGRFALNVVDDLIVVHHQSSRSSQVFDIMEEEKVDNNVMHHIPVIPADSMKPAMVGDQLCPMYSDTWVVFQPSYIIDARLGCLWRVRLLLSGLVHCVPKDEISKLVAVLLRRTEGKDTVYRILNQLVADAGTYLAELSKVFDEINSVYKKWADLEVARNTAGQVMDVSRPQHNLRVVISQADICSQVLEHHADAKYIVQVVTAFVASICRQSLVVTSAAGEAAARALVRGGAARARLRAVLRRAALPDARPLACALLSLQRLDPPAAQLALDMMWRLRGHEEVVEVLLSQDEPVAAVGAARQGGAWGALAPRKVLAAARSRARAQGEPTAFTAVYHALLARNERTRGSPHFLKSEQCDAYVEYYKQITADPQ